MSTLNIPRDVTDPFYRYKMEKLQSKIEGKGNGIKTVVVNLSSVGQSLDRPPEYLIKYFGFELGAQTTNNFPPPDDRWIINGAHESPKLQDYLDGFITRFVLCKHCKNPETGVNVKNDNIRLDCKACGNSSVVDPRYKLSSFIVKHAPSKKGKKDKSTKKAERKARKQAQNSENGENGHRSDEESPEGSNINSDQGDGDNGEVEMDAGSDDELTRRINAEAKEIGHDPGRDLQWTVDTSEAAVKARAQQLPDDLKKTLVVNGGEEDEDGDGGDNAYAQLGSWLDDEVKKKGGVSKVDDVDVYKKAKDLGIEKKHKTLTVLAQAIFDENIVKQIDARTPMLKKMITSEKHEKALLGGTERFVGITKPELLPLVSNILIKYYNNDLVSEEVVKAWGSKASKRYVDIGTSKKVRKSAEKFITWLETAPSDDEDDDEDED